MGRKLFLLGLSVGLSVTSLVLSQQSAPAADDKKTIEIVKNAGGKFVFSEPNVEIKPGQSIIWMAVDAEVPHQLVPAGEGDAFTDTGTFDATDPPTQSFDTPRHHQLHLLNPSEHEGDDHRRGCRRGPGRGAGQAGKAQAQAFIRQRLLIIAARERTGPRVEFGGLGKCANKCRPGISSLRRRLPGISAAACSCPSGTCRSIAPPGVPRGSPRRRATARGGCRRRRTPSAGPGTR